MNAISNGVLKMRLLKIRNSFLIFEKSKICWRVLRVGGKMLQHCGLYKCKCTDKKAWQGETVCWNQLRSAVVFSVKLLHLPALQRSHV